MAKGYIEQGCINFCSRYLERVEIVFNRPKRNDDTIPNVKFYLFHTSGQRKGQAVTVKMDELSHKQAH